NYGPLPDGGSNLTAVEMRKIFGDAVCADAQAGKCDLIPEAQKWMEEKNSSMVGGHCYGFSVAAMEMWQGARAKPADFGADTTPALTLPGNLAVQKQIAYSFVAQFLDSVRAQTLSGPPTAVIAKLKEVLVPNPTETYTIGIF